MTLRKKLNWGLGFLFATLFGLVALNCFYLGKLAADADNILKDNYVSVVYAKSMAATFDEMYSSVVARALGHRVDPAAFDRARAEFEKNLSLEQHNITEAHEKEHVEGLVSEYGAFVRLSGDRAPGSAGEARHLEQLAPTGARIRTSIGGIFDVNMQAILRKNQLARASAQRHLRTMGFVGAFFIVLALGYFWYFPFFVSNSLSFLAGRMKELVHDAGVTAPATSDDELFVILNSIDSLRASGRITGGAK
jgi:two-component system, NtrC family, sensor histidine kinase KinB